MDTSAECIGYLNPHRLHGPHRYKPVRLNFGDSLILSYDSSLSWKIEIDFSLQQITK